MGDKHYLTLEISQQQLDSTFELTGLPAEEFGFPAGDWDISATDSETDSGTFTDEEYECWMGIELFEGTQMITTDGSQIEVMQAYTSPLPWGMTCHIANLFMHAFEGTEDAPTLEDLLEDSTEDIVEDLDGGESYDYDYGKRSLAGSRNRLEQMN